MASPTSSAITNWSYDVFLSFRGEDTRKNFASHLYTALCRRGIYTFRDDQKLERGKSIAPELRRAINLSRFSVIILSENYASSSWCLDELIEILECMDFKGQKVVPVLYNVDPSDVKKQKGIFKTDFDRHEESFNNELNKVQSWRKALKRVAELSGWDSRNRDESLLIEEIVNYILKNLESSYPSEDIGLVGMSSRIREFICFSCMPDKANEIKSAFELDGVHIVGIWGMGGIGKTTVARAAFDRIAKGFDGCCFLDNVREESKKNSICYLQKQLLCRTLKLQHQDMDNLDVGINFIKARLCNLRVLIVLDDVDSRKQLESLAGGHKWFGKGSKIIITTRKRDILRGVADEIYQVKGLPENESMELFCQHAFKQIFPDELYVEMSEWLVDYTKGNPLALKVLGSFLYKRSKIEWQSALEKLKRMPHDEIYNALKISFDDLDSEQKDVFLDIACFLKGKERNYVLEVLNSCGFSAEINLSVLMDRCLIDIPSEKLWMHDLIQEMGQEVVRRKLPKELGKRSRLMYQDDVKFVLATNTGTKKIEAIALECPDVQLMNINSKSFSKMHCLRLLIFDKISFDGLSGGFNTLPAALKYMYWRGYPYHHLPVKYNLENLVILNMPESGVEQLWKGTKHPVNLKVLNLKFSRNLIGIPDLSTAPNLEVIILSGCTSLLEVHPSIGLAKKLTIMKMDGCAELQRLPNCIQLESLKSLILSNCRKLRQFPRIYGKMNSLFELALDGTAVEELPSSVENLTGLISLNLKGCWMFKHLPESICKLKSLKTLILKNCFTLKELPQNLDNLESLEILEADGSALTQLPISIMRLRRVQRLSFDGCNALTPWSLKLPSLQYLQSLRHLNLSNCNLVEVTSSIGQLSSLRTLNLSRNKIVRISECIAQMISLEYLNLAHCESLKSVQLPLSIKRLDADSCASLETIRHVSFEFIPDEVTKMRLPSQIFLLTNCSKLDEHQGMNLMETIFLNHHAMLAKLGRHLLPLWTDQLSICFPGSEIPEWFSCCAEGSSVSMELPSNKRFNYDIGAMVLCVVVSFHEEIRPRQLKLVYQRILGSRRLNYKNVSWKYDGKSPIIGSNHVILIYLPCYWVQYYKHNSRELLVPNKVSINFELSVDDIAVKIKKCGIGLIDTKHEGGKIQAKICHNTPVESCYYGDAITVVNHNGEELGSPIVGEDFITLSRTSIKRPHEGCSNDEAESSVRYNENVQAKRIKEF